MTLPVRENPVVQAHLASLRDQDTPPEQFRKHLHVVSLALAFEAAAHIQGLTTAGAVTTPLGPAPVRTFHRPVALVPILRAALGMLPAFQTVLPHAAVWHVDMERDPDTLQPIWHRNKVPPRMPAPDPICIVLDPMLATGGSASAVLALLAERGALPVLTHFVGVLAAPEGMARLETDHPKVRVTVGAVDEKLNERGYIVPGLGDAGDRQFGTHH